MHYGGDILLPVPPVSVCACEAFKVLLCMWAFVNKAQSDSDHIHPLANDSREIFYLHNFKCIQMGNKSKGKKNLKHISNVLSLSGNLLKGLNMIRLKYIERVKRLISGDCKNHSIKYSSLFYTHKSIQ